MALLKERTLLSDAELAEDAVEDVLALDRPGPWNRRAPGVENSRTIRVVLATANLAVGELSLGLDTTHESSEGINASNRLPRCALRERRKRER